MDGFGSFAGSGGLLGILQRLRGGGAAAPAVPADGAMQPTIGPGAQPTIQGQGPMYKPGIPSGGILGLLQGQSPQGLLGLLNAHLNGPPAEQPLSQAFNKMPHIGMLGAPGVGMPGSPVSGPVAPPAAPPQLPMNINPMDQF